MTGEVVFVTWEETELWNIDNKEQPGSQGLAADNRYVLAGHLDYFEKAHIK